VPVQTQQRSNQVAGIYLHFKLFIILLVMIYYNRYYTYQQRGLRRQHGPYPTEHGAHGHHGGPHPGGEYLSGKHVNYAKRDGYCKLTDQKQRQPY